MTSITEQARDILTHIATLGNRSSQNQDKRPNTQSKKQQNKRDESEGEISFGEELNEIFESKSETREAEGKLSSEQDPCNSQTSEIDKDLLSEEKEQEYKTILENVVKNVHSSLGMFSC